MRDLISQLTATMVGMLILLYLDVFRLGELTKLKEIIGALFK